MIYRVEALQALEPRQIATWMMAHDWSLLETRSGHSATYRRAAPGGEAFEVTLPLNTGYRDYARRLWEILETLAIAHDRPAPSILSELQATTFDLLRLRADGPGVGAGRVGVDLGARLFTYARDLLLAAACSASEPRTVYPTRKPTEAINFLRRVKLAAPEQGSFIINIHAPIPPSLQLPPDEALADIPFERRATLMLAGGVQAASRAAEEAGIGGGETPFLDGTSRGISANLCDAIAGFVDGEEITSLDLHFGWATSRPAPVRTPTHLHVGGDLTPLLKEGARVLRARAPRSDFELEGIVVGLDSENPENGGMAIVTCQVDGQSRKVRLPMDRSDYALAIQAHRSQSFLKCEGDLRRDGRRFLLDRVRHLTILESDD